MKKHLILVKHSLPQVEETVPAREWHLCAEGKLRAERLAQRLMAYQPEVLISSVETKARETAERIAALHSLEVRVAEDLHEHDRSNVTYLSGDEFDKAVGAFFKNPETLVFGTETANQAQDRFSKAVHALLDCHPDQTVVIVSHGTVLSLFVSRLLGISDHSLWKELGLPGFVVLDLNARTLIAQENVL